MKKPPEDIADITALLRIMMDLRDPDGGCPWDIEQTFTTIAPYTLEEAYEVNDAIQRGDMAELKDELGDLLLQVVFNARIAEENGDFNFSDVVQSICEKMIRRHPHVYANEDIPNAAAQKANWEEIKAAERSSAGNHKGVLDGVPSALPALVRAVKLQNRAARVGFDWPNWHQVIDKAQEEIQELTEAAETGEISDITEELGDLLFVYANFGRHFKIDPEAALRGANHKFERRFRYIEEAYDKSGKNINEATLEELDALWDEAKVREKSP